MFKFPPHGFDHLLELSLPCRSGTIQSTNFTHGRHMVMLVASQLLVEMNQVPKTGEDVGRVLCSSPNGKPTRPWLNSHPPQTVAFSVFQVWGLNPTGICH